jgi:hypothetical protein
VPQQQQEQGGVYATKARSGLTQCVQHVTVLVPWRDVIVCVTVSAHVGRVGAVTQQKFRALVHVFYDVLRVADLLIKVQFRLL